MDKLSAESHTWRQGASLLLAILFATSTWVYIRRVLVPYQRADARAHDHPRGNLSDLYPRWYGARELLLHDRDPYSQEVTREIQAGYYGRALDPSRPGDPKDQQAFAYPVYVIFLLAPFIHMPFQAVRIACYVFITLITAASILVWLRAMRWNASKHTTLALVTLVLGSMPVVQAIELQQLSLIVAAMLAACALLLVRGNLLSAGIVLAMATIKPQLVLPLAVWLTIWSLSKWRHRGSFLLGFLGTLAILFATAEWILPGWIREFIHAVAAYRQYTQAKFLFEDMTNPKLGCLLSIGVSLLASVVCWQARDDSEQSPRFMFCLTLALAATLGMLPTDSTYNQVLLLPAVLFLIRHRATMRKRTTSIRLLWSLNVAILLWPWVVAFCLAVASFILPEALVQRVWMWPFYTNLVFPVAVLALLFQYGFQIKSYAGEGELAT